MNSSFYGYSAALLTTIAFIPQLYRTWKTKSADDVSIYMLLLFITGLVLWVAYGWQTHSTPVLIANVITLLLNLTILGLKFSLKSKPNNAKGSFH